MSGRNVRVDREAVGRSKRRALREAWVLRLSFESLRMSGRNVRVDREDLRQG